MKFLEKLNTVYSLQGMDTSRCSYFNCKRELWDLNQVSGLTSYNFGPTLYYHQPFLLTHISCFLKIVLARWRSTFGHTTNNKLIGGLCGHLYICGQLILITGHLFLAEESNYPGRVQEYKILQLYKIFQLTIMAGILNFLAYFKKRKLKCSAYPQRSKKCWFVMFSKRNSFLSVIPLYEKIIGVFQIKDFLWSEFLWIPAKCISTFRKSELQKSLSEISEWDLRVNWVSQMCLGARSKIKLLRLQKLPIFYPEAKYHLLCQI